MYTEGHKSQENRETDKAYNPTRRGEFLRKLKQFFYEAREASASLNQTNSLDELLRKL